MFINVKKYVDFLIENEITERQFLLCYLLYTDAIDTLPGNRRVYSDSTSVTYIYKLAEYASRKEGGKGYWTKEEVLSLVKKGFLRQLKPGSFEPDMLIIEEKLIDALFVSNNGFDEFWDLYPSFLDIEKGKPFAKLKAVDKDEMQVRYEKIVVSKEYHQKVMSILRWAVSKKTVNMGIEKYIASRQWVEDEKLMKEETSKILSIQDKRITDD